MKHYLFEFLGENYPHVLADRHGDVLLKIARLWGKPGIQDYFFDLIVDKRGGRRGFSRRAMAEILHLSKIHGAHASRKNLERKIALDQLAMAGIEPGAAQFFAALRSGDQRLIELFIRSDFDIDLMDETGDWPLIIACEKGFVGIAKSLVISGADVNCCSKSGTTPLLFACQHVSKEFKVLAALLVKRGASIDIRDPLGYTPLMHALAVGSVDLARLLVERGAEVNARSGGGVTPFSLARILGKQEVTALLLGRGARE